MRGDALQKAALNADSAQIARFDFLQAFAMVDVTRSSAIAKGRTRLDLITSATHVTTLPLEIEADLSCPICLCLLDRPHVTECLHRFCHECIQTSLRVGKKECPTCRHPVATRRALRADKRFEAMIAALFPDGTNEEAADLSTFVFEPKRQPRTKRERGGEHAPVGESRKPAPAEPRPKKKRARVDAAAEWGQQDMRDEQQVRLRDQSGKSKRAKSNKEGPPSASVRSSGRDGSEAPAYWTCAHCTLSNPVGRKKCNACAQLRTEPSVHRGATTSRTRAANGSEGRANTDVMCESDDELEYGADAPDIEAQLQGRSRMALHIIPSTDAGRSSRGAGGEEEKSEKSEEAISLAWCFPPSNPGACDAWISLAPAHLLSKPANRIRSKVRSTLNILRPTSAPLPYPAQPFPTPLPASAGHHQEYQLRPDLLLSQVSRARSEHCRRDLPLWALGED